MIAYDFNRTKRPQRQYLEPVKALLSVNNKDWQFGFNYDAQNETLSISSPNLLTLKYKPMGRHQKSVLRFLNIKKLVIAGESPLKSLHNLNGLELESLNISQSQIVGTRILTHRGLSEVIKHKTQADDFNNNNPALKVIIVAKNLK